MPAPASACQRLRVGVVGGGLIAQIAHLPLLHADAARFELVALAEPSARVRERLAARYGIAYAHADHRPLMELPLDAIVVCAPNALHAAVVLDALDAGRHVLVEKPLCLSPGDADRIADRASATGLVVQVGYMKRFSPAYEALASDLALAAPTLRLVSSITVDPVLARDFAPPGYVAPSDLPPDAVTSLDADTAAQVGEAIGSDRPDHARAFADAFLGALVHDVNLVHGLLGPVSGEVLDAFHEPAGRVAGGTVELPTGGRWSSSWLLLDGAGCFSEDVRLLGDEGEWRLRLPAPYLRPASGAFSCRRRDHRGGWHTGSDEAYADLYARQLAHFHACITGGAPPRNGPQEARDDIALLTRLFRAALAARTTRGSNAAPARAEVTA